MTLFTFRLILIIAGLLVAATASAVFAQTTQPSQRTAYVQVDTSFLRQIGKAGPIGDNAQNALIFSPSQTPRLVFSTSVTDRRHTVDPEFLRRCSESPPPGRSSAQMVARNPDWKSRCHAWLTSPRPASVYRPIREPERRWYHPVKHEVQRVFHDYRNLYSRDSMLNLGVGIGVHAILSNTSLDQDFRNGVQNDVRSGSTDDVAKFFKTFGEGKYFIPLFAVGDVAYRYAQEHGAFRHGSCALGEFASRSVRTYLVGFPVVLAGQYAMGCSRPNDFRSYDSAWNPFADNNAISGHAFMGATPFLVAAQMDDRLWWRATFYALSVMPGLSRINDDAHYLSQVLLGWYVSYLSVRAVSQTDGMKLPKGLTIFPITESNSIGFGFHYRR